MDREGCGKLRGVCVYGVGEGRGVAAVVFWYPLCVGRGCWEEAADVVLGRQGSGWMPIFQLVSK